MESNEKLKNKLQNDNIPFNIVIEENNTEIIIIDYKYFSKDLSDYIDTLEQDDTTTKSTNTINNP